MVIATMADNHGVYTPNRNLTKLRGAAACVWGMYRAAGRWAQGLWIRAFVAALVKWELCL